MTYSTIIGRYEGTFRYLAGKFRAIEPFLDPKGMYDFQLDLARRIRRVERKIRMHKRNNSKSSGDIVGDYQRVLSTLKNFGDGLAFKMVDRFDLKPMSRGGRPGFISDKVGFRRELEIARAVASQGAPALLADLTNFVRLGDLLVTPEYNFPLFFEVQTNKKNASTREIRQQRRLRDLGTYLLTDKVQWQGKTLMRLPLHAELRDHIDVMASVSEAAMTEGSSFARTTSGTVYIATLGTNMQMMPTADDVQMSEPILTTISSGNYVNHGDPILPPVCWMASPEACARFYAAKLILAVIYDLAEIKTRLVSRGFALDLLEEGDERGALRITHVDREAIFFVSHHMYHRFIMEFYDLDWFCDHLTESDIMKFAMEYSGR